MIEITNLERTFKVLNRKAGLKGTFLDLFSRDYKYVKAVNDISMTINDGEIVGYVGPNGAGKSTTIKMMTGVLKPTGGTIRIDGKDPYSNRKAHMKQIGVVFGQRSQLWWSLPVQESFRVLKDMYEVSDEVYQKNLELFESLVNIKELYAKPVRQMSLGQRMLCEVTAAFLHDPKIVFLDEPTIGLDVAVKDSIRMLIKQLNEKKGTTIVLTSHDTKDIEALCERVIIIDKGTLIFDDEIAKLKEMFGRFRTIRLQLSQDSMTYQEIQDYVVDHYSEKQVAVSQTEDGQWVDLVVNEEQIDFKKVLAEVMRDLQVQDVRMEDVGVEEVIKRIYEGGKNRV
ncbi:MAG: ATP-binding cassette domain-containing protein [Coprococcus sp.]